MSMFARIVRLTAAAVMTAMSMGLTSPGAPVSLAAAVAPAAPSRPAASSDNYLSHLSFDQGTLVPAFISTTQEYVLTLPYTYSVMMSYTTNSTVTFYKSVDGCYGDPLTCDLSRNNVLTATIKIWAEDQSTRVYTVTITRPLGVPVDPLVAPVVKLSHGARADHKCAVLRTGEVLCWGANEYGQLGLGTTTKEEFVPLTVTGVTDAIDVAVGFEHTCILRAGGMVQCMGRNNHGQLGDGTATDRSTPVDVLNSAGTSSLTGVTRVSLNMDFTCAAVDESALCWGRDAGLNDPYNTTVTRTLPLTVAGVSGVVDVAAGEFYACALTNAGKVQCWGANINGEMGIGTTSGSAISAPVTMKDPTGSADLTGVTALRTGMTATCVILASKYQLCAGYNGDLTLGDGTATDAHLPVTTTMSGTGEALANVVQSAPSSYHGCTLTAGGTVHCSGSGYEGVLGIGLGTAGETSRVVTVTTSLGGPPLSGVVEVASGYDSTCARTAAAVYCWGYGGSGRLGSGVFDNMLSPHLSIVIPPSTDASLSDLAIDPGTLTPAFVSSTTSYTAEVPNGTTSVAVTATTTDVSATVAYSSSAGACSPNDASPSTCAVAAPKTWITVTVTAADGETKEEYVIEIMVADANASDDASLADLTMTPGTLTPSFVSGTTSYTAEVPNGTTSVAVTATTTDMSATVAYSSSVGACTAGACAIAAPKTWITVTVTAANGDVQEYVIEVTVDEPPAGLATIDRVWPGSGVPAGGMPVSIFGEGFVAPLTVTVGPYDGEMVVVTPTSVTATRIGFVMPAGTAGQYVSVTVATADGSATAANAFLYVAPAAFVVDGETGGEFVTPDGLTITVPAQGVSGSFYLTMTPLPPEPGVPGNILMYSFRLDAVLNSVPLASLTNPVTIQLPIDENIFAIQDGERPWLYQWISVGGRPTAGEVESQSRESERRTARATLTLHSDSAAGRWTLVRGQQYEPTTRVMTVGLRPMGLYALSTAYLRTYYLPVAPVAR